MLRRETGKVYAGDTHHSAYNTYPSKGTKGSHSTMGIHLQLSRGETFVFRGQFLVGAPRSPPLRESPNFIWWVGDRISLLLRRDSTSPLQNS
ncbi:hypothetical protein VNO77_27118 [Canavalia gladiata]|uniref:Uncharacterized protein n=1 Tax=Canavalia gladiata TaxID=3824 RepID=A0AAN9KV67_CANGL